jgi:hypothetical protein
VAPAEASAATSPVTSHIDETGRYRVGANLSWTVVGVYVVLAILLAVILPKSTVTVWGIVVILVLLLFFLARYLSTAYWIDSDHLTAFRLVGGRRIRLEEVRRIEAASLRELSPTGFFGSWGYRGRMWSPVIGNFDSVQTNTKGIMVYAGPTPLYITPKHQDEFLRELSRRVRSYRGPLEVDHGAPAAPPGPS